MSDRDSSDVHTAQLETTPEMTPEMTSEMTSASKAPSEPHIISVDRLNQILSEGLPQARELGLTVESAGDGECVIRLPSTTRDLRPGGTISGPTMMGLADAAMWVSVMSSVGDIQLAVTTSFNINFLRRPPLADLIARGETLKLGKRLAVLSVTLYSEAAPDEPVAHATGTYSIPKTRH